VPRLWPAAAVAVEGPRAQGRICRGVVGVQPGELMGQKMLHFWWFFPLLQPLCDLKNMLQMRLRPGLRPGPRYGGAHDAPQTPSRLGRGIPPPHTPPLGASTLSPVGDPQCFFLQIGHWPGSIGVGFFFNEND